MLKNDRSPVCRKILQVRDEESEIDKCLLKIVRLRVIGLASTPGKGRLMDDMCATSISFPAQAAIPISAMPVFNA
ncbi:hypothetical protein [Herbaspirillum rhizosphaerae]|uniref:hypothetical protein n=1 Tax=Herbaspirillum rhizosphaerae TaxID=346179 RepID=UPI0012ED4001|nr:hypothetical protein [Herbaspirillum rhizosphaerae]